MRFKLFFAHLREAPYSQVSGGGWEVSEGREGETDWRLKTDLSPSLSDLRSKLLSTRPEGHPPYFGQSETKPL